MGPIAIVGKKPPLIHSQESYEANLRESFEIRPGIFMPDSPMSEQEHTLAAAVQHKTTVTSAIDGTPITVDERDTLRSRYHIFISHAQTEASGDVGTLFFLFEQMGVHGWRDMNQIDLTEEGMRRGVYDSDVFILFLTNSYLSRRFCLAEITYALEFDKPIIIVSEQEGRFWPFDLERWQQNRCMRIKDGEWAVGGLQTTYETCPAPIRDLIEARAAEGSILPFRRRDFEVNALTREIVRRVQVRHGERSVRQLNGVKWGSRLPPPPARTRLNEYAERSICIFARQSDYTTAVIDECMKSILKFAPCTDTDCPLSSANHVLMVLSKGCVDAGTSSAALLEEAADAGKTITFLYITSKKEEMWDFGEFYALHARAQSKATEIVSSHEALKYRDAAPETMHYEHDAMILEILKRMRVSAPHSPVLTHPPVVPGRQIFSAEQIRDIELVESARSILAAPFHAPTRTEDFSDGV